MINKMRKLLLSIILIIVLSSNGFTQISGPKIAFFAEHEGGLHIFDFDSGQIDRLDVGMSNVGNLDFHSGKKLLVFEGSKGHHVPRSIYIYDFKRQKVEQIYKSTSYDDVIYRPKFHPNGEHIFAVNYFKGIFKYSFTDKTWNTVKVDDNSRLNAQGISFSQTGKKVAISTGSFWGFLIAEVENDRFTVQDFILEEFRSCTAARWQDDNTIIFAGRKEPGHQYIWKYSIDDKDLIQLTDDPIGTRDYLTLSKDKETVVFTGTDKNFEWRLWKISSNGNDLKKLTHGGNLSSHLSPVWIE
jgi:Tol biopolymer transport system component